MTDDELRALERAAIQGGGAARVRYARALARAGRRDDALAALLPARDDAVVRRELAQCSWWCRTAGGAGATSFVDVPPLATEPRVRYSQSPRGGQAARQLLASPLGTVWRTIAGGALVLDDAGAVRHRVPVPAAAEVMIAGELLVVAGESKLEARDLWTGAAVGTAIPLASEMSRVAAAIDGDLLVLVDDARVTGFSWPGSLERGAPLFEWELPARVRDPLPAAAPPAIQKKPRVLVTETLVVVSTPTHHVAFDRATGREQFQGPGRAIMADARGVVLQRGNTPTVQGEMTPFFLFGHVPLSRGALTLVDPGGAALWESQDGVFPLALAPSFVVCGTNAAAELFRMELLVLDRATGAERFRRDASLGGVAVARDVLYLQDAGRGLVGVDPDGLPHFRFPLDGERLWFLAPCPRGLFLLSPLDGAIVRLEEAVSGPAASP